MEKIAIIYTTFLRDKLFYRTINSILANWRENFVLLIADQSPTKEKIDWILEKAENNSQIKYYPLLFDCGLSYSRNFLINIVKKLNIPYSLITADSIEFNENSIKLEPLTKILKEGKANLIGLGLNNRVYWEYYMKLDPNHFRLIKSEDFIEINNIKYKKCDIVKNFFLAETDILSKVKWDNDLKLSEHEDFFWRFKQNGFKVLWTDYASANYIEYKPQEYKKYRQRMYKEFRDILRKKYNIKGWVTYER